jgi:DNA-binding MarR family transcriptional regulator
MKCNPNEALGFLVNITAQAMKNRFANVLKPFCVTPEQYATLMLIDHSEDVTLTDIANLLYKDKTTITRTIDALEKKEYVKKIQLKNDKRAYKVTLTQKAIDMIDEIGYMMSEVKTRQEEMFSQEEIEILKNALYKLRNFEYEKLVKKD